MRHGLPSQPGICFGFCLHFQRESAGEGHTEREADSLAFIARRLPCVWIVFLLLLIFALSPTQLHTLVTDTAGWIKTADFIYDETQANAVLAPTNLPPCFSCEHAD